MCNVCPKSCGGLVTAAVFIAAGIVQLIAGLILLRSKYVYMLSGPDFWTATANISVGCLLGVIAAIWKRPQRRKTVIVVARYNLIAALLISSITVNVTTCTILIVSEGNTLLSIQLEKDGKDSIATLNSEMLGYAYAASVISPALCIVLAVANLSARCCPRKAAKSKKPKPPKRDRKTVLSCNDPNRFNWVFTISGPAKDQSPEQPEATTPSSSGGEFDSSLATVSPAFSSPTPNNRWRFASIKELQTPLGVRNLNKTTRHASEDSELSGQSFDATLNTTSMSPLAGEVVPVQVGRTISKGSYRIGLPVCSPIAPEQWTSETLVKTPVFPTTSFQLVNNVSSPVARNFNFGKKRSSFASFHGDRLRADFVRHCSQIEPIRAVQLRGERPEMLRRMDSIAEDAFEDPRRELRVMTSPLQTSDYGSSFDVTINSCSRIPAVDYPLDDSVPQKEFASKKRLFCSENNNMEREDVQALRL